MLTTKYTIFKTKWGYFGLAGNKNALLRTCLPLNNPEQVKSRLIISQATAFEERLFEKVQEQIKAYFEGSCVNFGRGVPVVLDGLGLFARRVLTACRDIKFGQTVSYSRLAKTAGCAGAARAVGGALARNPLPLIIPCHRVVCANGGIGGFSAMGGAELKKRMLNLEEKSLRSA